MSDLIIELSRVSLRRELLAPLRAEFEAGGLTHGRFAIGDITAAPTMVYFLWHDTGDVPVSMIVESDEFQEEAGARAAARSFLAKWTKRLK